MKGIIPNIRENLIGFRGIVRNVAIILYKKYFKILEIENIGYAIGQIFARTESIIKTHCVYVAKNYFLNSQWIPKNIKQHFEAIFIPIIQSVKETEIDIHSFSAKKPSIIDVNYDIFDIIPEYKSINIGHLPDYSQNIYTESNVFNVVPVGPYLFHIDLIFESKKQFNYKNIHNINIDTSFFTLDIPIVDTSIQPVFEISVIENKVIPIKNIKSGTIGIPYFAEFRDFSDIIFTYEIQLIYENISKLLGQANSVLYTDIIPAVQSYISETTGDIEYIRLISHASTLCAFSYIKDIQLIHNAFFREFNSFSNIQIIDCISHISIPTRLEKYINIDCISHISIPTRLEKYINIDCISHISIPTRLEKYININNISNAWMPILTKSEVISNIDLIKSSAYVDFIDMSQNIQVDIIASAEHLATTAESQNIQVDIIVSAEHVATIAGFEFKKQITITGSPNAGTNYQVQFNVGESAGSVGSDFHVNGNTFNFPNGKNNSGDIRFTDFTSINALDFWVESVVGVAPNRIAKIWVEVREDLSVDRNIFIFYRNSAATNVSNGDNTFIFFDDFVGTEIDIAKWNIVDSTGFSVVTDELRGSNTTGRLLTHKNFSNDIIQEVKARTVTLAPSGQIVGGFWINISNGFSLLQQINDFIRNNATWSNITNVVPEGNVDFLLQFIVSLTTVNLKITRLDTNVITYDVAHTNSVVNEPIMLGMRPDNISSNQTYETFWDWIRVRKFVSPEPSFANISHEITTGRNIQFTINESSGFEHISPVILQLTLSEVHTLDTSVDYTITGGTAINGVDYHLTAGTATIPAGQLTTNIGNITIINDTIAELSETIEVGLSNPVNAGMGLNKFHTYTIFTSDIGWLTGFGFRIPITIPHTKVTTDEINYAIYIKLRNTNLNFANTRNDGFDIRFTAFDGLTTLNFERDRHDKVGLKGDYMVRIPFVSATVDTSFFMYYGKTTVEDGANPTAVWDINVMSRHSLKEDPSGVAPQMKDSTANANHGTAHGAMTSAQSVEGKIGRALDFDGVNDYVEVPDSASLDITSAITVEAWIRQDNIRNEYEMFVSKEPFATSYHIFAWRSGLGYRGISFRIRIGGVIHDVKTLEHPPQGVFVYYVCTYDGSNLRIFANGVLKNTKAVTGYIDTSAGNLMIGNSRAHNFELQGLVDEVRISNIARSPTWIALQNHSMNDTLLIYGPEETAPI